MNRFLLPWRDAYVSCISWCLYVASRCVYPFTFWVVNKPLVLRYCLVLYGWLNCLVFSIVIAANCCKHIVILEWLSLLAMHLIWLKSRRCNVNCLYLRPLMTRKLSRQCMLIWRYRGTWVFSMNAIYQDCEMVSLLSSSHCSQTVELTTHITIFHNMAEEVTDEEQVRALTGSNLIWIWL